MMDAPDPPETPNPYASAAAQTGANVNTAIANTKMANANVYGPTGSSEFTQTGTHQIKEARKNKDGTVMTQKVWKPDDPEAAAQYRREVEGTPTKTWISTGGNEGQGGYYQETGGGKRYIDTRTGQDWIDGGQWVDETQYDTYDVPVYRQDIKLSENQQRLLNYQEALGIEGGQLGLDQLRQAGEKLRTPFEVNNIAGIPGMVTQLDLERIAANPELRDTLNVRNVPGMDSYQRNVAATTYDANGMPDFSGDRLRVEDAIYSRLNPQLEREKAALDNKLVNEGFQRGTEAYNRAMDEYGRQANDARMAAVLAGGQEQSRQFADALSASNFRNQATQAENATRLQAQGQEFQQEAARGEFFNSARQTDFQNTAARLGFNNSATQAEGLWQNQARQAMIQEALLERTQPMNEIAAFMGGSQVQMPQFAGFQAATIPTTPVGDYIYKTAELDQRNYQAELAAQQASMSGLFGLGSSLIGGMFKLSDRRLKTDIEWLGTEKGLGVYRFRYLAGGPPQIGYMADEVKALYPGAVITENGIDMVDYERISA